MTSLQPLIKLILLARFLPWFGIQCTALKRFVSYLSSRIFRVKVKTTILLVSNAVAAGARTRALLVVGRIYIMGHIW